MPLDDMQAQRHMWDAHAHAHAHTQQNQHPELLWKDRLWYMAIFMAASFACLGYIFWLVIQQTQGRKKQKDK
jgi:hypothetical protein